LDVGQELLGCRLEHAEPQGLKPDVRVVEILNGRLNEQDFHYIGLDAPGRSQETAFLVIPAEAGIQLFR
jgi:hypothetical protein